MPRRSRLKRTDNPKRNSRLDKLTFDEIDNLFDETIRLKMTDKQFWDWVKDWKDPDMIVEEAESWDVTVKLAELKKFEKQGLI